MASGNDAAYTVAVATARAVNPNDVYMTDAQAVAYFAELMNKYANSLGMKNSHFVNPEGWDDTNQYTTVSDLLKLADHAFSVPEIRTITGTYQKYVVFASGENITWTNSNALLDPNGTYYCSDAVGMKTGTTANAGNCLIAAFKRNEKTYISAVVGCNSNADRYELTLKMLSNYTSENNKGATIQMTSTTAETTTEQASTQTTSTRPAIADKSAIFERLDRLDYNPITCDGLPEYKLTANNGTVYWLNFSSKWVRKNGIDAEAVLPDDMISQLAENSKLINLKEADL